MNFQLIRSKLFSHRFFKFSAVGFSGLIVNMSLLWFFKELIGLYYLFASLLSIELSVINNFIWNDLWTWGDRQKSGGWGYFKRLLKYNLSASVAAVIGNLLVLVVLKEQFGWNYLLANLVGIGVAVVINYVVNDRWTFRDKQEEIEAVNF